MTLTRVSSVIGCNFLVSAKAHIQFWTCKIQSTPVQQASYSMVQSSLTRQIKLFCHVFSSHSLLPVFIRLILRVQPLFCLSSFLSLLFDENRVIKSDTSHIFAVSFGAGWDTYGALTIFSLVITPTHDGVEENENNFRVNFDSIQNFSICTKCRREENLNIWNFPKNYIIFSAINFINALLYSTRNEKCSIELNSHSTGGGLRCRWNMTSLKLNFQLVASFTRTSSRDFLINFIDTHTNFLIEN